MSVGRLCSLTEFLTLAFLLVVVRPICGSEGQMKCSENIITDVGHRSTLTFSLGSSAVVQKILIGHTNSDSKTIYMAIKGQKKTEASGYNITVKADNMTQTKILELVLMRTEFKHAGIYDLEMDDVRVCCVYINVVESPECNQVSAGRVSCSVLSTGPLTPNMHWTPTLAGCVTYSYDNFTWKSVCPVQRTLAGTDQSFQCAVKFAVVDIPDQFRETASDNIPVYDHTCSVKYNSTTAPNTDTHSTRPTTTPPADQQSTSRAQDIQNLSSKMDSVITLLAIMTFTIVVMAVAVFVLLWQSFRKSSTTTTNYSRPAKTTATSPSSESDVTSEEELQQSSSNAASTSIKMEQKSKNRRSNRRSTKKN